MQTRHFAIFTLLAVCAPLAMAGGHGDTKPKKVVIIDDAQAGSLTNQTDRLMHSIRIPEVDFRQAAIADIVQFLSECAKEYGKSKESKDITIVLGPKAQKELMTFEKWEGGGGIKGIYTFSGLDMSLLEAVTILEAYAELERTIVNKTVTLELKEKKEVRPAH